MKKIIILLTFSMATTVFASEQLISTRTVTLPVNVSKAKVKFSNKGYDTTFLVKIIVPELAAETIMNHRNEGEDGPCLATYDTDSVEHLIGNNPGIDKVQFEIKLTKETFAGSDGICRVSIREDVHSVVRGFNFFHTRSSPLPNRVAEDCN